VIDKVEKQNNLALNGVVHSHPAGMDYPSGPDAVAMDSLLSLNPQLTYVIAPIVTHNYRGDVESHELALGASGHKISFYTKERDSPVCRALSVNVISDESLLPTRMYVAKVNQDMQYLSTHMQVEIDAVQPIKVDGKDCYYTKLDYKSLHAFLLFSFPDEAPKIVYQQNGQDFSLASTYDSSIEIADRSVSYIQSLIEFDGSDREFRIVYGATIELAVSFVPNEPAGWKTFLTQVDIDTKRATLQRKLFKRTDSFFTSENTGREKRIAIFGCGSVGSTIAEQLTRSGMQNIDLIDIDTVSASNIARAVYTVGDCGMKKVDALASKLRLINPCITIRTSSIDIKDDPQHYLDFLQESDVLVVATDNSAIQQLVSRMAYSLEKLAIFPGVYKAAEGGEIIFVHPSFSPCYACCSGRSNAFQKSFGETDYGTGRFSGVSALGSDIAMISSTATKYVVGIARILAGSKDEGEATNSPMRAASSVLSNQLNYLKIALCNEKYESITDNETIPKVHYYQSHGFWWQRATDKEIVRAKADACQVCSPHDNVRISFQQWINMSKVDCDMLANAEADASDL